MGSWATRFVLAAVTTVVVGIAAVLFMVTHLGGGKGRAS